MDPHLFLRGFHVWATNFFGDDTPWILLRDDDDHWEFGFIVSDGDHAYFSLHGVEEKLELKIAPYDPAMGGTWTMTLSMESETAGDFLIRLLDGLELFFRRLEIEIETRRTDDHCRFLADWLIRLGEYFQQPKYAILGHINLSGLDGDEDAIERLSQALDLWNANPSSDEKLGTLIEWELKSRFEAISEEFEAAAEPHAEDKRMPQADEGLFELARMASNAPSMDTQYSCSVRPWRAYILKFEVTPEARIQLSHLVMKRAPRLLDLGESKSAAEIVEGLLEVVVTELLDFLERLKTARDAKEHYWVQPFTRGRVDYDGSDEIYDDYMREEALYTAPAVLARYILHWTTAMWLIDDRAVWSRSSTYQKQICRFAQIFPMSSIPIYLARDLVANTDYEPIPLQADFIELAQRETLVTAPPVDETNSAQSSKLTKALAARSNWAAYADLFDEDAAIQAAENLIAFFRGDFDNQ